MRYHVLMGVSGCGKSPVGTALQALGKLDFLDGDDLHPRRNIDKMAQGIPLNDQDRAPWLADVGRALARHHGAIAVGCSALEKRYRDRSRDAVDEPGHFIPASLPNGQMAVLEPREQDAWGREIDITQSFDRVIAQSEGYVRETMI